MRFGIFVVIIIFSFTAIANEHDRTNIGGQARNEKPSECKLSTNPTQFPKVQTIIEQMFQKIASQRALRIAAVEYGFKKPIQTKVGDYDRVNALVTEFGGENAPDVKTAWFSTKLDFLEYEKGRGLTQFLKKEKDPFERFKFIDGITHGMLGGQEPPLDRKKWIPGSDYKLRRVIRLANAMKIVALKSLIADLESARKKVEAAADWEKLNENLLANEDDLRSFGHDVPESNLFHPGEENSYPGSWYGTMGAFDGLADRITLTQNHRMNLLEDGAQIERKPTREVALRLRTLKGKKQNERETYWQAAVRNATNQGKAEKIPKRNVSVEKDLQFMEAFGGLSRGYTPSGMLQSRVAYYETIFDDAEKVNEEDRFNYLARFKLFREKFEGKTRIAQLQSMYRLASAGWKASSTKLKPLLDEVEGSVHAENRAKIIPRMKRQLINLEHEAAKQVQDSLDETQRMINEWKVIECGQEE